MIVTCLQYVAQKKEVQLALRFRSAMRTAPNRQKISERPVTSPIVDRHFEIPQPFDIFCLFDSGTEYEEGVITFVDRDNVNTLQLDQDLWLCGGTFKLCPMQLYQLYTVHNQLTGFRTRMFRLCFPMNVSISTRRFSTDVTACAKHQAKP